MQRMHHIARSLCKFGHDVNYISPAINAQLSTDSCTVDDSLNYCFSHVMRNEEVCIYQPLCVYYQDRLLFGNYTALVQKLIDTADHDMDIVIIAYMPYQVNIIKMLHGTFKVIYECVDDHADLKNAYWGNKQSYRLEQELMSLSDAITTTSTALFLQRSSLENRDEVYFSPNAVNEADFVLEEDSIPDDLKNIPEPKIVYIGALYDWFDKKLFYEVVKSNPSKSFIIIGFGKEDILDKSYPNLYILGPRKHRDLKKYLHHMNIGIIPFKDDTDIIVNCDPIKQYEYLSCGLPVVTTFIPDSAIFKPYTFQANTASGFNKAIESALQVHSDPKVISEFLTKNSWHARAALLCKIADHIAEDKAFELKNKLNLISENNPHPYFMTLYAMACCNSDKAAYLNYMEKAFELLKTNFITRHYINALIQNDQIEKAISIAINSEYIIEPIRNELLYRMAADDLQGCKIVLNFSIRNYEQARKIIETIDDEKERRMYLYLCDFIMNNGQSNDVICFENVKKSPLILYAQSQCKQLG